VPEDNREFTRLAVVATSSVQGRQRLAEATGSTSKKHPWPSILHWKFAVTIGSDSDSKYLTDRHSDLQAQIQTFCPHWTIGLSRRLPHWETQPKSAWPDLAVPSPRVALAAKAFTQVIYPSYVECKQKNGTWQTAAGLRGSRQRAAWSLRMANPQSLRQSMPLALMQVCIKVANYGHFYTRRTCLCNCLKQIRLCPLWCFSSQRVHVTAGFSCACVIRGQRTNSDIYYHFILCFSVHFQHLSSWFFLYGIGSRCCENNIESSFVSAGLKKVSALRAAS
jgi:hypothetical protein